MFLENVNAGYYEKNIGSGKVLKNCGFEIEGIRETQEPVSEVTRQQSNKVNAMLSKVLGKINFTHLI